MRFSVIIPLYNKAPYVRKALESVCAQTYRDYELIVINDGSTDNSAVVADEFLTRTDGIDYKIINQSNAGVSAARNNGFSVSSADYIAFLDADDWWEPNYLERMAQLIEDYPDAGLYASNYYYHKDGVNIIKVDIPTGYFNYPKEYFKNFAMPITSISVVIPSKVYDEMCGFPIGVKLGEDFLLWAKIAVQYPVAFLNEPLAYYNNTLPPNYRATCHLHKPEEHMLFRLEVAFGDREECKVESVRCKGTDNQAKGERLEAKGMEDKANGERLEAKGTEDSVADNQTSTPYTLHPTLTEASRLIASSPHRLNEDWQRLIDMLRLLGLHSYWLSEEYHEIAQREIDKVNMSQQYDFLVKLYRTPRWIQKMKQRIVRIIAPLKHKLKQLRSKKSNNVNIIIDNEQYRESLFGNK